MHCDYPTDSPDAIISEHSHTPYDKVWNDSDRNYWMTAEEAKEYGMIDQVLKKK